MITLSQLFMHPVKSMRGLALSHAQATTSGLAFDRIFMITELYSTFITSRQHPQMVLFTPAFLYDGLYLAAQDGSSASIRLADFAQAPAPTEVWCSHFTALIVPDEINQWLLDFFSRPVHLRWVDEQPTRRVKRHEEVPLSFADGFPYLLTNEASQRDLQNRFSASVNMTQFRHNMLVTGVPAWAADTWKVARIGGVTFDVVKPCSRCIFTTVSQERGLKYPSGEPLKTLQGFRTAQDNSAAVDFGQNLIARNSGVLRVADEPEVLAYKPANVYGPGEGLESLEPRRQPVSSVNIDWEGTTFQGNNQHILLEQLENEGIHVPYSCRAGICVSCRIRLLDGEVKALKKGAIGADGTILCCSCVPAGNVSVAPR